MKNHIVYYALAGILRLLLMHSDYQNVIADRVEVSTALNSWKRSKFFVPFVSYSSIYIMLL